MIEETLNRKSNAIPKSIVGGRGYYVVRHERRNNAATSEIIPAVCIWTRKLIGNQPEFAMNSVRTRVYIATKVPLRDRPRVWDLRAPRENQIDTPRTITHPRALLLLKLQGRTEMMRPNPRRDNYWWCSIFCLRRKIHANSKHPSCFALSLSPSARRMHACMWNRGCQHKISCQQCH